MPKITTPDKTVGDKHYASEYNAMKAAINELYDGVDPGLGEATRHTTPSAVLDFSNPLGATCDVPLTGNQTFSKPTTGKNGAVDGKAYTASGTSTITLGAGIKVLNADFQSGQALAAGNYLLLFSNWTDVVYLNIAKVGAGTTTPDTTAPSAPQNISITNITTSGYQAAADSSTDA